MSKDMNKIQSSCPTIVCLCGSTRFLDVEREVYFNEMKAGRIVLSHSGRRVEDGKLKDSLNELHLRKIDLADEVLILNVGAYIGSGTRAELEYAQKKGKKIRFLEAPTMKLTAEDYLNRVHEFKEHVMVRVLLPVGAVLDSIDEWEDTRTQCWVWILKKSRVTLSGELIKVDSVDEDGFVFTEEALKYMAANNPQLFYDEELKSLGIKIPNLCLERNKASVKVSMGSVESK